MSAPRRLSVVASKWEVREGDDVLGTITRSGSRWRWELNYYDSYLHEATERMRVLTKDEAITLIRKYARRK